MAHNNPGYDIQSRERVATGSSSSRSRAGCRGRRRHDLEEPDPDRAQQARPFILALVRGRRGRLDRGPLPHASIPRPRGCALRSHEGDVRLGATSGTAPNHLRAPQRPSIEHWIELMVERIKAQFHPRTDRPVRLAARAATLDRTRTSTCSWCSTRSRTPTTWPRRYGVAVSDMPVPKDIVVTTPAEILQRGLVVGTVLKPALEDGRTVYARV